MERHFPDGMKEITFPDGTLKYIYPDGEEERYEFISWGVYLRP